MLLWKHPLFEGVTHWQQPVCSSWWISVIFIRSISVPFTCWISVACVIFNCCGFCLFGAWPSFCDMTGRGTACDVRTWLPYSTAHHFHRLWDVKTSKLWWSNQKSITSLLVQDVLYKFLSLKVYSDIFITYRSHKFFFVFFCGIFSGIFCDLQKISPNGPDGGAGDRRLRPG